MYGWTEESNERQEPVFQLLDELFIEIVKKRIHSSSIADRYFLLCILII